MSTPTAMVASVSSVAGWPMIRLANGSAGSRTKVMLLAPLWKMPTQSAITIGPGSPPR